MPPVRKAIAGAAGSFLRLTPKSNCVDGVANSLNRRQVHSKIHTHAPRAHGSRANKQFWPNHDCPIRTHTKIYTPHFLSVIVDNLLSLSFAAFADAAQRSSSFCFEWVNTVCATECILILDHDSIHVKWCSLTLCNSRGTLMLKF